MWRSDRSGEQNLLNLVLNREYSNLAGASAGPFSGAAPVPPAPLTEEFYASMTALDYTSLSWRSARGSW
jgi:hypothetical protein